MWQPMTIDEYAALLTAQGTAVTNVDGVWWKRVRPFFYQPLFPLQEIEPLSKKPPAASLFGGYRHIVPASETANCTSNFIVWKRTDGYSVEKAAAHQRTNIKKGQKYFSVREMQDLQDFIAKAHAVYLSFYERTKYEYKRERTDKNHFAAWAEVLFRFPKVKILGAYHGDELCAVHVSYLVQSVLIEATAFSRTEALKYQVSGFLSHVIREQASACPDITLLYEGSVSGNKGIDEYKLRRGCTILTKPAFYRLNPFAELMLKQCMKKNYQKLIGRARPHVEINDDRRICSV